MANNNECPLCRLARGLDRITETLYEDNTVISCYCKSHPSKILIVLKRHTPQPTPEEAEHMQQIAHKLFPNKQWRGPKSILDHFHLHELS